MSERTQEYVPEPQSRALERGRLRCVRRKSAGQRPLTGATTTATRRTSVCPRFFQSRLIQCRCWFDCRLRNPANLSFSLEKKAETSPPPLSCFSRFEMSLLSAAYSGSFGEYPSSFDR